jgi:hypothetical protein
VYALIIAIAIAAVTPPTTRATTECTPIPVMDEGAAAGSVCADRAGPGLTVIDLADDWAPKIFSETPDRPQPYRATFVALANERREGAGETARRDRYYELFGISPSLSVIRARLLDRSRHACHAAIDDEPLRAVTRKLAPAEVATSDGAATARRAALSVVQRHLACDGFLADAAHPGDFDASTHEALALYQRRHMLPSRPVVDVETRRTLLTDSRELDFRTLLRALRERVVDATGLVEDGSALNAWEPVLGRFIDSDEYRHELRAQPVTLGAADLVARATETAARALGWTSPDAAAGALALWSEKAVAIRLPPPPAYHTMKMEVRAEIDRGDVWTSHPLDAEGRPRRSPAKRRPTFILYAKTVDGDLALVRWPTTIGAWKEEKVDDESIELRYKASPVGRFYWRDLVAAPAWFPPPTTPDRELLRRGVSGRWTADEDAIGPGYRSAYGLVALLHNRAQVTGGGPTVFHDVEIRTHGSGNYRSILRGGSHGCHRLFNHLAIRLGGFLLAHTETIRQGTIDQRYARALHWQGRTVKLRAETRGYRYEIVPPIPVDVLPGRAVRSRAVGGTPTPSKPADAPPPQQQPRV